MKKRAPKPWFRPSRGCWYITLDGRQHNLGACEESEAWVRADALKRQRPNVSPEAVVALIDAYLDWCQKHRAAETYRWYLDRLQSFAKTIEADLTVSDLKPFHVQKWVDTHDGWSKGSRRNAIAAVKRVFHWAEEQGYIDRSPIAHLKKPQCGKKEVVVPAEHYQRMLDLTHDEPFRDLLTVTWETGCRPQESLRVEARHVDLTHQRWLIPTTPGKPDNRVVYMTDAAMQIVRRLVLRHPTGKLFRNTDGKPWTTDAVNCRFHRFVPKIGVRYSLYAIRHTWITRMLEAGVDSLTVAILAGHKDPSMLAKHYAHLSLNPKRLLDEARKAAG
ncbi:MAG: tyrosine-type recombinase/integrase [Planctomycetes bacterium]|nr:tyrosine-type recombinase/integrase [Planctomycetota bacterium]